MANEKHPQTKKIFDISISAVKNSLKWLFITMILGGIPIILFAIIKIIFKIEPIPHWLIYTISTLLVVVVIITQIRSAYKSFAPLKQQAWIAGLLVFFGYTIVVMPLAFLLGSPKKQAETIQQFSQHPLIIILTFAGFGAIFGVMQLIGSLIVSIKSKLNS